MKDPIIEEIHKIRTNDFLSKPYEATELFMRLESALHQQALIRAQEKIEKLKAA